MWVVAIIFYLFIGFVIGSGMCINAGDDPRDQDSFSTIVATGIVWPVVLIIVACIALVHFTIRVTETMFTERSVNDNREEKDSNA